MKVVQSLVIALITMFCFLPHKGSTQDIVFMQLDKNVIVTGESVFYKAYLLNSKMTNFNTSSKILYIQITDPVSRKSFVFRSDISSKGTCSGLIPIPDTLNTGYYLLTAYTNGMRNLNPELVYSDRILVINQAGNTPATLKNIVFRQPSDTVFKEGVSTGNLHGSPEIVTDKKVYVAREKVTISIKNLPDSIAWADVSISVTAKNPFEVPESPETNIAAYLPYMQSKINAAAKSSDLYPGNDFCRYPEEDKGFIFAGRVVDKTNLKPIPNVYVLLTVADSVANLKYALTYSTGKFYFLLGKHYNNRELILQLKDSPVAVENLAITMDDKTFNPYYLVSGSVMPDSVSLDFISTCRQSALVNKIYNYGNITGIPANVIPIQDRSFFGKPDEVIRPSEFLEMPNFEDIVANIIRNAKYKFSDGQSTLLVVDGLSHQFWEGHNALVLLNNIPVFDYNILNSLGSKLIQRIELKTNHMYYGSLEIFGIISIFTKEDFIPVLKTGHKVVTFPNEVLVSGTNFISPDYSNVVLKNSKIPDFRQTLYWNPDFGIDTKDQNTIEFYTSDLKTTYDIIIQGISEKGIPVSARSTIEVR